MGRRELPGAYLVGQVSPMNYLPILSAVLRTERADERLSAAPLKISDAERIRREAKASADPKWRKQQERLADAIERGDYD